MRLHDDRRLFGFAGRCAALAGALALGLGVSSAHARPAAAPVVPANGPQADYPVVVGPAYAAAGTGFTPEDVLNYDQVGYVAADLAGGNGITGSHHTLPLPSYVEVTSLASGRTILVRLERRGPMDGTELVALSPGALAQLSAAPGTPVRVRRVVPPEEQRAMLREGRSAPLRMDTPMSLVDVLKRKLPGQTAPVPAQAAAAPAQGPVAIAVAPSSVAHAPLATARPLTAAAAVTGTGAALKHAHAVPALPPLATRGDAPAADAPRIAAPPRLRAVPAAPSLAPSAKGTFVVQAGAFSTSERASKVAHVVGGGITRSGNFYRVRTGPFTTHAQAEASLAKVRAAGYSEARIQTSG